MQAHKKTLQNEIDQLISLNILRPVKELMAWSAPIFTIPKKDETMRKIHDFQKANIDVKRKLFPFLFIQNNTQQVGIFKYTTYMGDVWLPIL